MSVQWDPGTQEPESNCRDSKSTWTAQRLLDKRAAEKLSPGKDYKVTEGLSSRPVAEAGSTRGPHTHPANPGHTRNSRRGSSFHKVSPAPSTETA